MEILSENKNEILLKEFYKLWLSRAYYNGFYRIKDLAMKTKIIKIYRKKGKRYISLTEKGKQFIVKLNELEELYKS